MKLPSKTMWLWILLSLAALVLVLFVVGNFLPERYRAEETIELALSPSETWQRLHEPARYPMSTKQCRGVELLPADNGRLVWSERLGNSSLTVREVVSEEGEHLVRELEDTVVPFTSRAEFWLEPTDAGGTRVRCTNDLRIAKGTWHVPLFRVMISLFGGARQGIRSYVGSLAKDGRKGAGVGR